MRRENLIVQGSSAASEYERELEEEEAKKNAQIARVKQILRDNGIAMIVDGCGCCGSPRVRVEYEGLVIIDDDTVTFDTADAEDA